MKSFKPIKISVEKFLSLTDSELQVFYSKVANNNKEWLNDYFSRGLDWIIVKGNKFKEGGYATEAKPSFDKIKRDTAEDREIRYLLFISNSAIKDLKIFFQAKEESRLTKIIGNAEIKPYLHENEKINTADIQSGVLNKIKEKYALGRLINHVPIDHVYGATVVQIDNIDYEKGKKGLHIGSQSVIEVHKRGSITMDERINATRIERLHRFDDPILDIFDAYNEKIGKPSLILYKGTKLDLEK